MLIFASVAYGLGNVSIIQVNMTHSQTGLLNGLYFATVSIIDHSSNLTIWSDDQTLEFVDGFTEIKLGPIDNLSMIESTPRVILEIDGSILEFPIYPSLFSVHSESANQLSDPEALYHVDGSVGFGTMQPTEKLTINGNIKFLNDSNSIYFSNGQFLNGPLLNQTLESITSLTNDIDKIQFDFNRSTSTIDALVVSVNAIESMVGLTNIGIDSAINQSILTIDADGTFSPLDTFHVQDGHHYILRSQDQHIHPTRLGSDFMVNDHELFLGSIDRLSLNESVLGPTNHNTGELRFSNGSYFALKNNEWHDILDNSHIKLSATPLSQIQPNVTNGAIAFDGSSYYIWKNNTWETLNSNNFSDISESSAGIEFIMLDSSGAVVKVPISTTSALSISDAGLTINDQYLSDGQLMIWSNHQLKSVPLGEGLGFDEGSLVLADPLVISDQFIGIGVSPTQTLDVNGAIRLRTHSLQSLSNVSAGTLVFDGSFFKGFDGTDWHILSSTSESSNIDSSIWTYTNHHLLASPAGFVGVKVDNPQSTLDIGGNLRVRTLSNDQSLSSFLVANSDGDIHARSLELSDLMLNTDSDLIQLNGSVLELSSMGASENDFLMHDNGTWKPMALLTDHTVSFKDRHLSLSTLNVSARDSLIFKDGAWRFDQLTMDDILPTVDQNNGTVLMVNDNAWSYKPLIDNSRELFLSSDGMVLSSQNASIGDYLAWDGSSWVPSKNTGVTSSHSFSASNGIDFDGQHFKLASNLSWENNTFTIGALNNYTQLRVNRMSSSLNSPLNIQSSYGETLLNINSDGELSVGLNGVHSGYSIASEGFNYFRHLISHKQMSVGTTNIGPREFGPTLLVQKPTLTVQSVPFDNAAATRSIVEVLSINAEPRLEIQEGGHVGISTGQPKATLDINGYTRLKKYTSEPIACDLDHDGSIALNSQYKLCVCNGSSWVESNDGVSPCNW